VTPYFPIPTPTSSDYSDETALTKALAKVCLNNETNKKRYTEEAAELQKWKRSNAALKLCILNTVPKEIYEAVVHLNTLDQFSAIADCFKESGVAEECTLWGNFFGLRAHHCASTTLFTD
jgi:hypothetical protein